MTALQRLSSDDSQPSGSGADMPRVNPLRVLFVIDSRFPGLGGAENQAMKLAQALHQRGVHVEYVAPMVIENQALEEDIDGIRLRRIDYPHIKMIGSILMMSKFAFFLIKHRKDFDCMHIHITRLLTTMAGLVRPIVGIPIITKISGYFEFEGGVLDPRKRWYPLNIVMRSAMKNVDYVQTISAETKDKLLSTGFRPDQIALIPNGIDTADAPALVSNNSQFTIGYCGRLREIKGVHVLLEGLAKAKQRSPGARFKVTLAGDGSYEPVLRQQIADLGIEKDVEFLGTVKDTAAFYSGLDLYVQPSFAEGLPNSVIEAMNAALAVVATNIGGNRDLIEEGVGGHLFEAGDTDALATLLLKCYDDRSSNTQMGKNGRRLVEEQYGMEKVTSQLIGVYRGE